MTTDNRLFYGDNLTIMEAMPTKSVDLIYLDPPFNSNRNYNILYKDKTGFPVPEQAEAFCDTWTLDAEKIEISNEIIKNIRLNKYDLDDHFVQFWVTWVNSIKEVNSRLYAYLIYMTVRLIRMRSLLKETGSIYLHCDPTASHYIKVVMDGIFGQDNFRNEIVWYYPNKIPDKRKKLFTKSSDTILFYTKNVKSNFYFEVQQELREKPINFAKIKKVNGKKINVRGEDGKVIYDTYTHRTMDNVWRIPMLTSSKERLGYPTQKPIALLNRIIKASCPKDGIVLDPFCGCGTSLYASYLNNRKWIGIDIAIHSINLVKETLFNRYGIEENKNYGRENNEKYIIDGIPTSCEGAKKLFEKDPFQFQKWIIEEVKGFVNGKKTGDKGIDGSIYFEVFTKDSNKKQLHRMILSVKGGNSGQPSDIRDLMGTVEREKTQMGGFLCMRQPTKKMIEEANSHGYYEYGGIKYKKCQLLSSKDILEDDRSFHVPNQIGQHKEKTEDVKLFVV